MGKMSAAEELKFVIIVSESRTIERGKLLYEPTMMLFRRSKSDNTIDLFRRQENEWVDYRVIENVCDFIGLFLFRC